MVSYCGNTFDCKQLVWLLFANHNLGFSLIPPPTQMSNKNAFDDLISRLATTPLLAKILNETPSLSHAAYYDILRNATLDDILASGNPDVYSGSKAAKEDSLG